MASFVVMQPPHTAVDARLEKTLLLRDGFSLVAFLLPVPWLLWNRLWIEALAAFAFMLTIGIAASSAGMGPAAPLVSFLTGLYFGLESNELRVGALRRRGWTDWGVVDAHDHADAELRYAVAAEVRELADENPLTMHLHVDSPRGTHRPTGPALGLFAYPGRN